MPGHHLTIENLTVSYDRVPAIHHVSLTLYCGHTVGLLGPNGAGKSTLLKAIAGLVPFETGRILFDAREHGQVGSDRGIAYLPQRSVVDWDFPLTVRGLVEMGRFPALGNWKGFSRSDHEIVAEALAVTRLEALADRQISALSGGQQQRAFLARAWAQRAHVYLLDEPFSGLDRNAAGQLGQILAHIRDEGKLVITSHHDLKTVADLFDEVILLNGELVAFGPVAAAFTAENVGTAFSTEVFTGALGTGGKGTLTEGPS
jgi:ABC-type Mn2+/Zn2+ transport system ATPase subunit